MDKGTGNLMCGPLLCVMRDFIFRPAKNCRTSRNKHDWSDVSLPHLFLGFTLFPVLSVRF